MFRLQTPNNYAAAARTGVADTGSKSSLSALAIHGRAPGDGQSTPIAQPTIDQLNVLWSDLAETSSPAFRTALEQERARFNHFRQFVNKNYSQWEGLLEIPAPSQHWIPIFERHLGGWPDYGGM